MQHDENTEDPTERIPAFGALGGVAYGGFRPGAFSVNLAPTNCLQTPGSLVVGCQRSSTIVGSMTVESIALKAWSLDFVDFEWGRLRYQLSFDAETSWSITGPLHIPRIPKRLYANCARSCSAGGGFTAQRPNLEGKPVIWRRWRQSLISRTFIRMSLCSRPCPSCRSTVAW